MSRILLPSRIYVGAGGVITFQGTAKDQAVYWSLIGHDDQHDPISALGSLVAEISVTDESFCAVNRYNSLETEPPAGYHDHLLVKAVIV